MATYKDPVQCFAPLEVIERLLEIRADQGYSESLFLPDINELADILDAYGFDSYSFNSQNEAINFGDYRSPLVPRGDSIFDKITTH